MTDEERFRTLEHAIFGNGKPGLVRELADHRSDFNAFCRVWEARESDKKTYDDRQEKKAERANRRINLVIALLTVGVLAAGAVIALLTFMHGR